MRSLRFFLALCLLVCVQAHILNSPKSANLTDITSPAAETQTAAYANERALSWDPIGDATTQIGNWVSNAVKPMTGDVAQAFVQAIDQVFENDIRPTLDQFEAIIARSMDRARDLISISIDQFVASIKQIIDKAAATAQAFVDHTLQQIKEQIINTIAERVKDTIELVFQDITLLLNKIDSMILDMSCVGQALILRIEDDVRRALPSWWNPFDTCRVHLAKTLPGHDWRWRSVSQFEPNELYEFRKCKLMFDRFNEHTPLKSIQMAYRDVELLAGNMRCLAYAMGDSSNEKYYLSEMGRVAAYLHVYDSPLIHISTYAATSPGSLRAAGVSAAVPGADCGTPYECYAFAQQLALEAKAKYDSAVLQIQQSLADALIARQEADTALSTSNDAKQIANAASSTAQNAQNGANTAIATANAASNVAADVNARTFSIVNDGRGITVLKWSNGWHMDLGPGGICTYRADGSSESCYSH